MQAIEYIKGKFQNKLLLCNAILVRPRPYTTFHFNHLYNNYCLYIIVDHREHYWANDWHENPSIYLFHICDPFATTGTWK